MFSFELAEKPDPYFQRSPLFPTTKSLRIKPERASEQRAHPGSQRSGLTGRASAHNLETNLKQNQP